MSEKALILAAGKGTRMRSDLPKPLVPINKKPIIEYITEAFEKAGVNDIGIIVGYKAGLMKSELKSKYTFIDQPEQKGTAHAVRCAENLIDWKGNDVFVFVGDSPLITSESIRNLLQHHKKTKADCTLLTSDFKMKLPYARIIRNKEGKLIKFVEEKNASAEELKITELLSSHFLFKGDSLFGYLDQIRPDAKNGEYYLTDIINIFLAEGMKVETVNIPEYEELVGLNTPEDVNWAQNFLSKKQ
jgi:bifunctional N-acetylglucosamine-1-phosphate-uridyltransferase/glucosamine-1-phosphate-acetyltransferase GlmU-like protein